MNTFILIALAVIILAALVLFTYAKRLASGEPANASLLLMVKWPLLFASAGFNCFFTYNVFSTFNEAVAIFAALVMGGVTLAETFLVRLIIAAWRHRFTFIYRLGFILAVPIFGYSLMAADSSFHAMLNQNQSVHQATELELSASQDRIKQAQLQARQASFEANQNSNWNSFYTESANLAHVNAAAISANEKRLQAQLLRESPPEITPNLLGFSLAASMVGLIVSLALEGAIIGVGFFEELFIHPTPLPALVQFMNKTLDWNITEDYQKPLKVEMSPAPSVVSFANTQLIPASGYGWQPKQPTLALPNVTTERPLTPDVPPLPNVKTGSEPNAFGYVGLVDPANVSLKGDVATAPNNVQATAFSDWLDLIKTSQLAPTMQPTKQFISERKLAKGIKLIAAMAEDWLDRAYNLGVLDENPDYGNGKSRYLLATGEGLKHDA